MAIETKKLERRFKLERNNTPIYLSDPNPNMSVDEVIDFYSSSYPELLNASHVTSELDGNLIYEFKTIAGIKG